MYYKENKLNRGFTLIELMIVMFISGVILISTLLLYSQYVQKREIELTRDRIKLSSSQISFFFSNTLRYPCPSDNSVPMDDPGFGIEFSANCANDILAATGGGPGCVGGGGICVVEGVRDADGDGNPDFVIIGGMPVVSIGDVLGVPVPKSDAVDAWGGRLTYAVSANLTDDITYVYNRGVIRAIDEHGSITAGIDDDAHYAIISHGPDNKGAFLESSGVQGIPCGSDAVAKDNENCDDDAIFSQALGYYQSTTTDFHDDYLVFAKSLSSNLWEYIISTTHIRNTNSRNIGINKNNPGTLLDVNGNIRTDNSARVDRICKTGTAFCMDVIRITANDTPANLIECPANQVMVGISNNEEICAPVNFSGVDPNHDCFAVNGVGSWVKMIRSDGSVECTNP